MRISGKGAIQQGLALLVVAGLLLAAVSKTVNANRVQAQQAIAEQTDGLRVLHDLASSLVQVVKEPPSARALIVLTTAPGSLAAAIEAAQSYLRRTPSVLKAADGAPALKVTDAKLLPNAGARTTVRGAGQQCTVELAPSSASSDMPLAWAVRSARCAPV